MDDTGIQAMDVDVQMNDDEIRIVPTKVIGVAGRSAHLGGGGDSATSGSGDPMASSSGDPMASAGDSSYMAGGGGGGGRGGGGWDSDDDDDDGPTDPYADVSFESAGGLETQIAWLTDNIVGPLKDKHLEALWGLEPVKGVLFYGPPGTGKTLLARAFGNEISHLLEKEVTFYHRRGGDLLSKWFGGSAKLIKALFDDAKAHSPSIIFLDELDGVCPSRDGSGTHQANISVVSSLLSQMDAIEPGTVFVFGATNRVDAIDPAMRRPGRFDKHLEFFLPTTETRKSIIRLYTKKWKQSHPEGDLLDQIGQQTIGYTGADLENLTRETFFAAFRRHIPNLDAPPEGGIGDMEVTLGDWISTMEMIKASSGTSYGSSLYTPKPPNGLVNPLVGPIQAQIVAEILQHFPLNSNSPISTPTTSPSSTSAATVNSFYIWDPTVKTSSNSGLESLLLPGVFGSEALSNYPVFMLDAQRLLSVYSSHRVIIMAEVILHATSSSRPCILYLPQLEEMIQILGDADNFHLYDQLTHLRGRNVLLVASGLVEPQGISNLLLRGLFVNSFAIPKNTDGERAAFFEPIFTQLKQKWTGKEVTAALDEVMTSVVDRTKGDSIETMVTLHAFISDAVGKFGEEKDFFVGMTQLLTNYSKKKLAVQ